MEVSEDASFPWTSETEHGTTLFDGTGPCSSCKFPLSIVDPLLSEYNRDSPLDIDPLNMDLNSQSSSFLDAENSLDDGSNTFKTEVDVSLGILGHPFEQEGKYGPQNTALLPAPGRAKKLDSLLVEKPSSEPHFTKGKKKKKPKFHNMKELAAPPKIAAKISVKKNYQINSRPCKKWTLVETDQQTLFGGTFRKKVSGTTVCLRRLQDVSF